MKAILLVRVSTDRQEFDEQERIIYNQAIKDGYNDCDIIPIREKESAIKLTEEERKGLNRMKEAIESDKEINCVYAWEISRIARKKKVLFSILDYLITRKIQLKIKEPFITLLNSDGTVNEASETTFTLFAQMAESEMRNKTARFSRSKTASKSKGKYIGGFYPFGYCVDEEGYFQIKEDEAEEVRFIFNSYVTARHSVKTITAEARLKGFRINKSYQVRNILTNNSYAGLNEGGVKYPQIISKEMFRLSREIAQKNNTNIGLKTKNFYLCAGLIKCHLCGYRYSGIKGTHQYTCRGKLSPDTYNLPHKCSAPSISINLLDAIVWEFTKKVESFNPSDLISEVARIEREIEELNKQIENCNHLLELNEKNRAKNNKMYKIDAISDSEYETENNKIKAERKNIENDIKTINEKIKGLNDLKAYRTSYETVKGNLDNITDLPTRREIIRNNIEYIKIYNADISQHKIIRIKCKRYDYESFFIASATSHKSYAQQYNHHTKFNEETKMIDVYIDNEYKCSYSWYQAMAENALYSRTLVFNKELHYKDNYNPVKAKEQREKNKEKRNARARELYKVRQEELKKSQQTEQPD